MPGFQNTAADFVLWIELYKHRTKLASLNGFHLNSGYDNPTSRNFSESTAIPPNKYQIIRLAGEPEETTVGDLHADFKLNRREKSLRICKPSKQRRHRLWLCLNSASKSTLPLGPQPPQKRENQPYQFTKQTPPNSSNKNHRIHQPPKPAQNPEFACARHLAKNSKKLRFLEKSLRALDFCFSRF